MDFGNLSASLSLNINNFVQKLATASVEVKKFGKNVTGQTYSADDAVKALDKDSKAYGLTMKSVSRVVSGIIISQTFYKSVQAVRAATRAVWEFTEQLEYAQIAYSNLFGSTELATEFINVLKDFAAKTPFTFSESEQAAKRLLAYGVKYQNVMYVMQGVLSAATMQGDMSKIEPISRALGQIYTNGRLMGQEVRQLAEAGIPVYEILNEKLGITQDQMRNLAKEAIPASVAINALVEGMNERFGSTLEASSLTIQGIISNLKDNAIMLMSAISEPLTIFLKSGLKELGDFVYELRSIAEVQGIGGVFERIIPPELQGKVRLFIANLRVLWQSIRHLATTLLSLLKPALNAVMTLFQVLTPIVSQLIKVLTMVIRLVTESAGAMKFLSAALAAAAAMWLLFKLRAVSSIIVVGVTELIAKALVGLATVLNFIVVHPIWTLIAVAVGGLMMVTGMFDKASGAVQNFFKNLTKLNGVDADKLLLPSQKDRVADLNKFNDALDTTADAMDDVADSTGNAAKAGKSLLSFDEVFKLNDPDESSGSGDLTADELASIVGSIGNIESFMPTTEDFENFATGFYDRIKNALVKQLTSMGIGALIGTLIGAAIGGPVGAKIGLIAGSLAGLFWDALAEQLGLSDFGKIAVPIGAVIGTGIGFMVGGPIGAAIGALAGGIAAYLLDQVSINLENGDVAGPAMALGSLLGAALGFVIGGPAGALAGVAIGGLVGWLVGEISEGVAQGDWSGLSTAIGTALGGVIGFVVGGPVGAAIGVAVGALLGFAVDKFIENWEKVKAAFTKPFEEFGERTRERFQEIIDSIKTTVEGGNWIDIGLNIIWGILKGLAEGIVTVFDAIGTFFKAIWEALCAAFGIHSPAEEMKPIGENILLGILEGFASKFVDFFKTIGDFFDETLEKVSNWLSDTWETVSKWFLGLIDDVGAWLSDTGTSIKNFFVGPTGIISKIAIWLLSIFDKIKNFFTGPEGIITKIAGWLASVITAVKNFFTGPEGIKTKVSTWLGEVLTTVTNWFSGKDGLLGKVGGWMSSMYTTVSGWVTSIKEAISGALGKISDLKTAASEKVSGWWDSATSAVGNAWNSTVGSWFGGSGHATGGIFDREHIARFAEDNKAEAVIPLENASAMQPFVNAISQGILEGLAPTLLQSGSGSANSLPPMYVGTLVADDRGLKQLYKKFELIQVQENARRGLVQ